jgi:hypothetical protein
MIQAVAGDYVLVLGLLDFVKMSRCMITGSCRGGNRLSLVTSATRQGWLPRCNNKEQLPAAVVVTL